MERAIHTVQVKERFSLCTPCGLASPSRQDSRTGDDFDSRNPGQKNMCRGTARGVLGCRDLQRRSVRGRDRQREKQRERERSMLLAGTIRRMTERESFA